jgi:hypothetical protein
MPRIREEQKPGGWRHFEHVPSESWPADCFVQWGAHGLVLGIARGVAPYTTAFFEAFPVAPSTFIRGEGATIAEAEAQAFAKWERIKACPEHLFERRGYKNGYGICSRCDFGAMVFAPLPEDPHAADCACVGCASQSDCDTCHGEGVYYGHTESCVSDECALSADLFSCDGEVQPCPCTTVNCEPCSVREYNAEVARQTALVTDVDDDPEVPF